MRFYTFISGYSGTSLFEDAWSSKWTELRPTGIESVLDKMIVPIQSRMCSTPIFSNAFVCAHMAWRLGEAWIIDPMLGPMLEHIARFLLSFCDTHILAN